MQESKRERERIRPKCKCSVLQTVVGIIFSLIHIAAATALALCCIAAVVYV